MNPIRTRSRRWLALSVLAAVSVCGWVASREAAPPDPVHEPTPGAIAQPAQAATPVEAAPAAGIEAQPAATPPVPHARRVRDQAPPPAAASTAGRVVAIDPETGLPGAPSPEQLSALQGAPGSTIESLTAEGLVETRLPNGTVILHLDERFHDYVIARVGRDGRINYGCVHDQGGVEKAMRDSTTAPALEVE